MARQSLDPVFVSTHASPRRKRRRLRIGHWLWRLGVFGTCGAFLCLVTVNLAVPLQTNLRQRGELREMSAQLQRKLQERKGLEAELRLLGTDAGKELKARKYGWIRPDEIPIVVPRDQQ